ncbi:MAG: DUF2490 domain-containing protein [Bacteroidia bacterium]|nr:DUF2490 domain-containing protein [Bacteroidia bacterium]MDW8159712.1 DUF2490 domain-containing protein [Bacteroidia bacterium]
MHLHHVNLIAQTDFRDLGTWNVLSINIKYNKKWVFFAESQLRSLAFYDQFHYYEVKGGGGWIATPDIKLFIGLGSYNTYKEGGNFRLPYNQQEIRVWQQLNTKQKLSKIELELEHRYRIEQRYTNKGYRNRFRYRLGFSLPIIRRKLSEDIILFMTTWNEIFFTNKAPYFERNRFFIGLGYEWNFIFTTIAGWIHQLDYRILDEVGKNFFQLSVIFNLDYGKTTKTVPPSSIE